MIARTGFLACGEGMCFRLREPRNKGVVMSSVTKRGVLGAVLALGTTFAVTVGLGVFAGTGVAAGAAAPKNTSPPTITGIPQEGHTLTGQKGTWTDSPTFTFFWVRCDKNGAS